MKSEVESGNLKWRGGWNIAGHTVHVLVLNSILFFPWVHFWYMYRESLSEVIIAELADYRHKRVMGLAGMFGDHMLSRKCSEELSAVTCVCIATFILCW